MAANIVITIRMVYNGGPWIRDPYDDEVIYQFDRFHIQQEIIREIKDKEARTEIRRQLDEGKPDDMLDYIKAYADSKAESDENDTCSKNAMKLYSYLKNNYNGLLPYQKQGRKIPKSPDGIIYKNMGVQENQNCTVITLRMKHRRMRWSVKGADNLAKVLYKKTATLFSHLTGRWPGGKWAAAPLQVWAEPRGRTDRY